MKRIHAGLAVTAAIVWGLIYIAARSMLDGGPSPSPVALRFMVALVALGGGLGLLMLGALLADVRSRIAQARGLAPASAASPR